MSSEKYIQIRAKVPIDSDGTVFKEFNANEKFRRQDISIMLKLLPLIQKYELDFLPVKVITIEKDGRLSKAIIKSVKGFKYSQDKLD